MQIDPRSISVTRFSARWEEVFNDTPPLGHRLRADYHDRWTRFHALPQSKRYADNADERAVILERANILCAEFFTAGTWVWIASVYAKWEVEKAGQSPVLIDRYSMGRVSHWTDPEDDREYQEPMIVFAAQVEWKPNAFDLLFSEIADDQERAILFEPVKGHVFAPYDGGFDIFLERTAKRKELETKYADWMSQRGDRL